MKKFRGRRPERKGSATRMVKIMLKRLLSWIHSVGSGNFERVSKLTTVKTETVELNSAPCEIMIGYGKTDDNQALVMITIKNAQMKEMDCDLVPYVIITSSAARQIGSGIMESAIASEMSIDRDE